MLKLSGLGVLVTRPRRQAMPLCRLLESQGARALRLPMIDVVPMAVDAPDERRKRGEDFDLAIFTSANAVLFGAEQLTIRPARALAAIGPATARALEAAGHRVMTPADGFDSEHLLAHPLLAALEGRHVLLIKGADGRELLRDELLRRGAHLTVANVYRRERVVHAQDELTRLEEALSSDGLHVVTATSVEIARGLLDLAEKTSSMNLAKLPWVVPGARIAAAVHDRKATIPILQATSAEDQALVDAIVRWRSSTSGA